MLVTLNDVIVTLLAQRLTRTSCVGGIHSIILMVSLLLAKNLNPSQKKAISKKMLSRQIKTWHMHTLASHRERLSRWQQVLFTKMSW